MGDTEIQVAAPASCVSYGLSRAVIACVISTLSVILAKGELDSFIGTVILEERFGTGLKKRRWKV